MRRLFILSILLILIFMSTGCSQLLSTRSEIDKIFVTKIIGIDKTAENKVLYTITTKTSTSGSPDQQGSTATSEILVSEGATVFEAARNMATYAYKKPHYGHTEFILFGEATAKDGILQYLDYISRNQEFRYNAKIYIVKGDSANSFINKVTTGNIFLGDRLSTIEDNAYALSKAGKVTLSEALLIFSKNNVSTFLPTLVIAPSKSGEGSPKDPFDIIMKNYAVFKEDKLEAFLDEELSRGINWVKNRIKSGIILVEAQNKKKISMDIIQNKTTIKPYLDETGLQCLISIKFNTNIAEVLSEDKLFTKEGFDYLKQQQEKQVKKEVEKILNYAQEKNMDIFGLVSNFSIKYPMMKNELRDNWLELFPQIKFNVQVESNINRTYLINEPANSK